MMNVFMSPEPVDLTPKFDALRADLIADNAAALAAINVNTETQTQGLNAQLESLATMNGSLSSDVQLINVNTNQKLEEVNANISTKSVIKSVQRGQVGTKDGKAEVIISKVNPNKSCLLITGDGNGGNYYITSDGEGLYMRNQGGYQYVISWEVIEYE